MKILLVFTGGTIGSTQSGNIISSDPSKTYKIINEYEKRYGITFDHDVLEPYNILSENATGDNIRMLVGCVKENLTKGYDGIIVTHGTDTLQYSSAALGYCLGLDSIPVCVISANAPIEDDSSNAMDNLHGAVRFIQSSDIGGAFSVYRNGKECEVRIHRATRLTGVKAYSDEISSIFDSEYGYFDESFRFVKNSAYREHPDETETLCAQTLAQTSKNLLVLSPYVGMTYPIIGKDVKYILINTYHSGTLDTESVQAREFYGKARENGVSVYAAGVTNGAEYASMGAFGELGIIPIRNIAPIAAYMKLWLLSEKGKGEVEMRMSASLSGDVV